MMCTKIIICLFSIMVRSSIPEGILQDIIFHDESITDKQNFAERLRKLQSAARFLISDDMFLTLRSSGGENVYKKQLFLFEEFVDLFQRPYNNNKHKFNTRFEIFQEGLQRQAALNKKESSLNGTAFYGINKYSDWTPEEFNLLTSQTFTFNETISEFNIIKHTSRSTRSVRRRYCSFRLKTIPPEIDWRFHTTKVKNQKNCGSCWAFVGSEQLETYTALKHNSKPTELSSQELVSCAPSHGCKGGNTCLALYWLAMTKLPLVSESNYPYEAKDSSCKSNRLKGNGGTLRRVCGCHQLRGREHLMLQVLAQKGPLAVNVDAVSWHDYIGGVVQHHCTSKKMNHAVQIVGYKIDAPVPYYIVRNQWGSSFGEEGYMRIKYGSNVCGVAEQPSYIVV